MYRVIEVSRMLGVSKVTIYKKMEKLKKELKNHTQKISNILYIDSDGVDIIRGSLEISSNVSDSDYSKLAEIEKENIVRLEKCINFFNRQIECKKNQIDNLDKIIETYKTMLDSL